MNVRTFYTSPIETNTYICHNDGSSEAIAIDVGEYIEDIKKYLIKNTFLHYTIRKELKVWKIKNYTSIHYVLQWYSYHL